MGDLSEHFSTSELRCHGVSCCGGTASVSPVLLDSLEMFRELVGQPVSLSCGFRCLTHNKTLGSKDTSQHPLGKAADIRKIEEIGIDEMARLAEKIPSVGGIGKYTWGIHIDVRSSNPTATWDRR